jgi:hypothetical protein
LKGDVEVERKRAALEVYVAGRLEPTAENGRQLRNTVAFLGPLRPIAERVMADHPHVSPDALAAATVELGSFLQEQERAERAARPGTPGLLFVALIEFLVGLVVVGAFGLFGALLLRGGILMRALGIAVVTRSGHEASRLRAFGRGLVAWSPLMALPIVLIEVRQPIRMPVAVALGVLFAGGAVWAALHPERGVQDRIAGTWLVPR